MATVTRASAMTIARQRARQVVGCLEDAAERRLGKRTTRIGDRERQQRGDGSAPEPVRRSVWTTAGTTHCSCQTAMPPRPSQRMTLAMGTPTARPMTPIATSSAGTVARPSVTRRAGRDAPGPMRAYRAPPRADPPGAASRGSTAPGHRQHGRRGSRERGPVLADDGRRERVEAEHRERAVLGEQVQAHEERTAQDGQPQLGHHHAHEGTTRAAAEGLGGLLEGRVDALQRRRDRQVHEREVGEDRDDDGATEARQRGKDARPAVAGHEGGDGEGRREQDREQAPSGQVGADDQPRGRDTERAAHRHGDAHQRRGVQQQLRDARTDDHVRDRGGTRDDGRQHDEGDRDERRWR